MSLAHIKTLRDQTVVLLCSLGTFDQADIDVWSKHARTAGVKASLETFCDDCDPAFKACKRSAGLCVAPDVAEAA